jgi:hypothetical protein
MDDNLFEKIEDAKAAIEKYRSLGVPKREPLGRLVAHLAEEANIYPVPNLAVEICLQSYLDRKKEELDKGSKHAVVEQLARLAYAATLPKLSNADCVRDFIACVVHGMAIGAIPSSEGTRLLYGAQIAHSALPGGKKRRRKYTKSTRNTPSSTTPTQAPPTT